MSGGRPAPVRSGLAAVALAVVVTGCPARPAFVVERLEVDAFRGGDVVAMSAEELEGQLRRVLADNRLPVLAAGAPAPSGARTLRLGVAAGLAEPDAEAEVAAAVQVVFHARLKGTPDGFEVNVHGVREATSNDVEAIEASIRDTLAATLADGVRQVRATLELDGQDDAAALRALEAKEPWRRDAALGVLVRRGSPAAIPPLVRRLAEADPLSVRAAMGALVELKAEQAVNPIIEASRGRGPLFQRDMLFALGAIGGPDAEAYLDLVATGNDDPVLRSSAEQALVELRARAAPAR